jgi:hypothetical protein
MGSYGIIYGLIMDYMGLFEIIWDYLRLYGIIWGYNGLYGIIWDYLGLLGMLWNDHNPLWDLQDLRHLIGGKHPMIRRFPMGIPGQDTPPVRHLYMRLYGIIPIFMISCRIC